MSIPQAFTLGLLVGLGAACGHAERPPAAAAPSAVVGCGPIACPDWMDHEIAPRPLPLRERCNMLSKVLMFQPLALSGRPLSAFEMSRRTGIGQILGRVAVTVAVHAPDEKLERSLFAAGETCGAGLLVLAPSPAPDEPEQASSVFRLSLTVRDPENPSAFDFALTAEPLQPGASTAAFKPLYGRVLRGAKNTGPDSWTVSVQATVNSADALKD